MKQGEVWWIRFRPPVGRRPAVLVSRPQAYGVRTSVTVVPLTQTIRGIPVEVRLDTTDGVPRPCAANADNLTTVPLRVLDGYVTTLAHEKLRELEDAMRFALGLAR